MLDLKVYGNIALPNVFEIVSYTPIARDQSRK